MTQTQSQTERAVWQAITAGGPVVIASHVRLDGDGIGSALALWHALRGLGIEARVVTEAPLPAMFEFLPGFEERLGPSDPLPEGYTLVVLDCGALERVGLSEQSLAGRARTVNIDHHATNRQFGDLNYVDPGASSCGELVYRLLRAGGVELSQPIAECLFAAIVSDTGQFSHQDTTPEALRVCAECVEAGARPDRVVRELFLSPSPEQVRLRQMALGTLQFFDGGRVATMEVSEEMFRQTGLGPADTEGLADVPISVQGVMASALLKEMPGCGYIKVSMRGRGEVDVCAVAVAFGGGGHRHAAGCEISDTVENVRRLIVERLISQVALAGER